MSLRKFCNILFSSSFFCFHSKPSYGNPHYGISLLLVCGSLLFLTSDQLLLNVFRLSFLFNLDYYCDKKSRTIFSEKLSACYISKIEMHCFQMRHMPLVTDIDKCSRIMRQIYTRKSVVKFDFVTYWNQTSARVFSCKFVAKFRASFAQNIYGRTLQYILFLQVLIEFVI